MNTHSSKQQSLNAKRKTINAQKYAIQNDVEFDELHNILINDLGIGSSESLSYKIPSQYRNHPAIKEEVNAKVYLYNDSDVRGLVIDDEVVFYLSAEQYRERIIQRILKQSQGRVAAIYVSLGESLFYPVEANEALARNKQIAPGVRYTE